MQRTRPKHGRRSYISTGIGGDSQGLLEREPLQSKDTGLLSYNIDFMFCVAASTEYGGNLIKTAIINDVCTSHD